ncbi:unnamed protein product [Prorocentrum cordatum]|nr:unnamed protein product [Polarella glacialis]
MLVAKKCSDTGPARSARLKRPRRRSLAGPALQCFDAGFLAVDCGAGRQALPAVGPAERPPASTANAALRQWLRGFAPPRRKQPLAGRGGATGTLERDEPRGQLASRDVHPEDSPLRSWPMARQPRQQVPSSAAAHRAMPTGRPRELCGCAAALGLAARRGHGLTISVGTCWRVSKAGSARITHSAASRLVNGSSIGIISSSACSSCAGDSSRAETKTSPAKRVGRGHLLLVEPNGSTRLPRRGAGFASTWPPRVWPVALLI